MTEELDWDWIEREVDPLFFDHSGRWGPSEIMRRFEEIPEAIQPLAKALIDTAVEIKNQGGPSNCLLYRTVVYDVYRKLKDEKGLDIKLPHGWFMDGVMVEPEWVVRITNGIVGWRCRVGIDNPEICGLDDCKFRPIEV